MCAIQVRTTISEGQLMTLVIVVDAVSTHVSFLVTFFLSVVSLSSNTTLIFLSLTSQLSALRNVARVATVG